MLSLEENPGSVVLKKPGSVVAQGPRLPGGVGVVFQLPFMGGARDFYWSSPKLTLVTLLIIIIKRVLATVLPELV